MPYQRVKLIVARIQLSLDSAVAQSFHLACKYVGDISSIDLTSIELFNRLLFAGEIEFDLCDIIVHSF